MRRLLLLTAVVAAGGGIACLQSPPSGPQPETPYAVVYGRIGAPKNTIGITVYFEAYRDSAHAVAGDTAGFAGSYSQTVTDSGNVFSTPIPAAKSGTFFLDVLATGQGHGGFVSSIDTVRALRVHFDSLSGGPHDSVAVFDSLP